MDEIVEIMANDFRLQKFSLHVPLHNMFKIMVDNFVSLSINAN